MYCVSSTFPVIIKVYHFQKASKQTGPVNVLDSYAHKKYGPSQIDYDRILRILSVEKLKQTVT